MEDDRVVLQGNVPFALASRVPTQSTDYAAPMERMILSLKVSPEAQTRLNKLLADQHDPASSSYHRWLTPQQFGEQFGPSKDDLAQVMGWLAGHGFSIDEVAPSGLTINFSGDVAAVGRAFQTAIMDFDVDGTTRHGNISEPSIPKALAGLVHGVVSLHNVPRPAHNFGVKHLSAEDAKLVAARRSPDWKGTANSKAGVYLSPVDWATVYNANTSFSTNGNGAGVVIGIVGRTNPGTANWATFRSQVGLPVNTPTIIINGTNPGDTGAGEDGEADLDAEWSGGCAPGATVKFVASKSTSSTDGVDLSAQYIVNNNLADVMSTSFGQCESTMGSTENAFYNNLWSQAAAQGITSCVSTGDSGAAGCAGGSATTGSGQSGVNGLASTPYNVAVGATQLSTSSTYWTTAGAPTGYIPETPWNESGSVSGGSGLWSTSSGASSTYAKPSWQVAPGVPTASHRYLPDVSLDGSDMFFANYGMLVYSQGAMGTTGGTSAAAPSFAGVMALIVQKYGRQGNANPKLYQLGNAQYSGTGTAVFHDITSGNNNVPGLTGFTAGTGWDEVTGLGTPDVTALVNNWGGSAVSAPSITTQPVNQTVTVGATATFSVTASGTAPLTYQWYKNSTAISGATGASYTTAATTSADNGATFYVTVTNASGSATSSTATLTVNATATAPAITSQPVNASVVAGNTATFTVTASGTAPLTYQWYKNGAAITGATAASYTTPATTLSDNAATFYVKVTNTAGTATSSTATLTVTSSGTGTELIVNGGFESGATGWTATSGVIAQNGTKEPAYAGTYDAWLCGYGSTHTDTVKQTVALPATLTSATLTFYLHIDTAETSTTAANDKLTVQVLDSTGAVLATLATYSNLNKTTGYTQKSFDLSAYKGKSVQIYFKGVETSSKQTSFVLDNVSLITK
jgi:subtilase family serine protease